MKLGEKLKQTLDELEQANIKGLEDELAKMLAEEIRREQLKEMCERLSWTRVVVKNWQQIGADWCEKYIKHKYQHLGNTWYFEDSKDANFFSLTWSS